MTDRPKIIAGLVIGLGALTFPFWYTGALRPPASPPKLEPATRGPCVEDPEFMRVHHMELLDQWRDAVVREGKTEYVSKAYQRRHEMSLTKTRTGQGCLGCHVNRETFCDRCHEYANVSSLHPLRQCGAKQPGDQRGIGCWDCHHVEAKGT